MGGRALGQGKQVPTPEWMGTSFPPKHKGLYTLQEKLRGKRRGSGEMGQQLRTLAALLEDLGSIPSAHMVAHSQLLPTIPGVLMPSPGFCITRHASGTQTYI